MNDIYGYCCDQFIKGAEQKPKYEEITVQKAMEIAHQKKLCMCDYYCKFKVYKEDYHITKEAFDYQCSRCPLAEVKEMYI